MVVVDRRCQVPWAAPGNNVMEDDVTDLGRCRSPEISDETVPQDA